MTNKERSDGTTARQKLIDRLLTEDCGELFDQFVVVGLEYQLGLIVENIEDLLKRDELKEHHLEDLIEHHHDGKAMLRVLHYYTAERDKYDAESDVIWRAYTRAMGEVF